MRRLPGIWQECLAAAERQLRRLDRAAAVSGARGRLLSVGAEDAHRNALNAHCYWLLHQQARSAHAADAQIAGLSIAAKNELLLQHGINFNELPAWHKRGVGLIWETYEKPAVNPKTGAAFTAQRRWLAVIEELSAREAYAIWLQQLISTIETHHGAY